MDRNNLYSDTLLRQLLEELRLLEKYRYCGHLDIMCPYSGLNISKTHCNTCRFRIYQEFDNGVLDD
jgi:hypothetical protein